MSTALGLEVLGPNTGRNRISILLVYGKDEEFPNMDLQILFRSERYQAGHFSLFFFSDVASLTIFFYVIIKGH